jgi:acyl dehydratase
LLASALVASQLAGGTMRMFKDFEEIKAAVGTEVGVSDWVEVTQQRIDQFAEATGDEQWIHVDVERRRVSCRVGPQLLMDFLHFRWRRSLFVQ